MTEINSNLVLYSINKKGLIGIILVIIVSWLLALIFYLNPTLEHDILVAFNDIRAEGELF